MKNVLWIIFAIFIPVRFPRIENVESKTMTEVFHIAHSNSSNIITSRYALAKKRFRLSRVKEKIYARPPQPLDHETKTIEREERLYIHKKTTRKNMIANWHWHGSGWSFPKAAPRYISMFGGCVWYADETDKWNDFPWGRSPNRHLRSFLHSRCETAFILMYRMM